MGLSFSTKGVPWGRLVAGGVTACREGGSGQSQGHRAVGQGPWGCPVSPLVSSGARSRGWGRAHPNPQGLPQRASLAARLEREAPGMESRERESRALGAATSRHRLHDTALP